MLLGEHAVLQGNHALVGAINRRITIQLTPTESDFVSIQSGLGTYQSPLCDLVDHPSFRFVLKAIEQHQSRIPSGFALKIESEFSADIGFGSSAAVTVATHAALLKWLFVSPPAEEQLFKLALETVQHVQGRGSGADVAASVFGGIVCYTTAPSFQPVPISVPITAVYCGYKTPTPEVIQIVEGRRKADPEMFDRIYSEMDQSAVDAVEALHQHDFPAFGEIINRNQLLMTEMGLNTPELEEIVNALQEESDIFGAKISGSGLGDCAIGIGFSEFKGLKYPIHHIEISPAGCRYHD